MGMKKRSDLMAFSHFYDFFSINQPENRDFSCSISFSWAPEMNMHENADWSLPLFQSNECFERLSHVLLRKIDYRLVISSLFSTLFYLLAFSPSLKSNNSSCYGLLLGPEDFFLVSFHSTSRRKCANTREKKVYLS